MTSPFRENNVVPLFGPPEREKGETKNCPACDACLTRDYYEWVENPKDDGEPLKKKRWKFAEGCEGVFCGPEQRVETGRVQRWWWWSKPKLCAEPGAHLHQKCWNCGAKWIRDCVRTV